MDEVQIKHMVDRFLAWKLPENFNPDGGISFERDCNVNTPWPSKREPVGTNLLDATQAAQMVRHMLEGLPQTVEPMFPIMHGPNIPWSLIEPYEAQAQRNHGQSLKRLAERGGLSMCEAMAIMTSAPSPSRLSKTGSTSSRGGRRKPALANNSPKTNPRPRLDPKRTPKRKATSRHEPRRVERPPLLQQH